MRPQDWRFRAGPHGKPFVDRLATRGCGPAVPHFNVTHTPGLVGCAVARHPLGLDVELRGRRPRHGVRRVAERKFAPAELAELRGLPAEEQARRFVELWTLKEACVKATGRGIGGPPGLRGFSVRFPPEHLGPGAVRAGAGVRLAGPVARLAVDGRALAGLPHADEFGLEAPEGEGEGMPPGGGAPWLAMLEPEAGYVASLCALLPEAAAPPALKVFRTATPDGGPTPDGAADAGALLLACTAPEAGRGTGRAET